MSITHVCIFKIMNGIGVKVLRGSLYTWTILMIIVIFIVTISTAPGYVQDCKWHRRDSSEGWSKAEAAWQSPKFISFLIVSYFFFFFIHHLFSFLFYSSPHLRRVYHLYQSLSVSQFIIYINPRLSAKKRWWRFSLNMKPNTHYWRQNYHLSHQTITIIIKITKKKHLPSAINARVFSDKGRMKLAPC